jgi:peptidylprolyl isomerase
MRIGSLTAAMMLGLLVVTSACSSDNTAEEDSRQAVEESVAATSGGAAEEAAPAGEATGETAPAVETTASAASEAADAMQESVDVATAEPTPQDAVAEQQPADGNTLVMQLESGPVTIALRPDLAPNHVERLRTLTRQGFYDGVVFHRVIPGFMAQTGDPTGTGGGGSDLPDLKAEFSDTPFTRGVIGMARTADPDSANSQFFITYADAPWLNGQYTVVGEVTQGMEAVDAIKQGSEANNGLVEDPDRIISMTVAADAG